MNSLLELTEMAAIEGRKPRILFVSNLFPDSGSAYLGLDNAALLHELCNFFDISVLSPRPSLSPKSWFDSSSARLSPRKVDERLNPSFVQVPYMPFLGTPANYLLMRMFLRKRVGRIVRKTGIDAIVCSWLYPDGCAMAAIARKLDVPIILITQGTDTHHYIHFPIRKKYILAAIEQRCAVISRSAALRLLLEQAGADADKIHPIYNGVDQSIFYPRDRALCRTSLGLDHDETIFVFVGNFLPVKNPEFLLRAFSSTASTKKSVLVMIGRGPMRPGLEKLCVRLGIAERVKFTGSLSSQEVSTWMGAADCLCLCSHNEGLPNVIMEAMATGLPVISTDVGGIGELLGTDNRGVLIEPGDREGYAEALTRVITGWQASTDGQLDAGLSWPECAQKHALIIHEAMMKKIARGGSSGEGRVCSLPELK
jgi:teichuronic acid biosynthesis glycosyltransferase TuaC